MSEKPDGWSISCGHDGYKIHVGGPMTLAKAFILMARCLTMDALDDGVWSADDVSDVAAALVEEMGKAVEAVKEVQSAQ